MTTTTPDYIRNAPSGLGSYIVSGVANPGRAYVVTGSGGDDANITTPTAGGDIDGVTNRVNFDDGSSRMMGAPAAKGWLVRVEAGGNVTDGADLEVDGSGRFVTASTGTVVARAVEGSSLGGFLWAVFV